MNGSIYRVRTPRRMNWLMNWIMCVDYVRGLCACTLVDGGILSSAG
jgi:hypothetical protein